MLEVPAEGRTRAIYPLWLMLLYREVAPEECVGSLFRMALVETAIANPGKSGSGEWRLRVE